jgi:hypothetical protein
MFYTGITKKLVFNKNKLKWREKYHEKSIHLSAIESVVCFIVLKVITYPKFIKQSSLFLDQYLFLFIYPINYPGNLFPCPHKYPQNNPSHHHLFTYPHKYPQNSPSHHLNYNLNEYYYCF